MAATSAFSGPASRADSNKSTAEAQVLGSPMSGAWKPLKRRPQSGRGSLAQTLEIPRVAKS